MEARSAAAVLGAVRPSDREPESQPPLEGDERTLLVGWLDFHRDPLAMKCDGLTARQLALRPIEGSALSLFGLVRHMTEIERTYFRRVFAGGDMPGLPFGLDPFGEGAEADFESAASTAPTETLAAWRLEVDAARHVVGQTASL